MKVLKILILASLVSTSAHAETKYATGLVQPEGWAKMGAWDDPVVKAAALPAHWNWNDVVATQPIRDQASCGSCWAFSIAAVVESLHRILYPMVVDVDMAEQTMVSSCESGGSCAGGYFSAFNYVQQKGIPPEGQDPYTARNSSCKSGLTPFHSSKITRWAYVGSDGRGSTVEQMKQAIYDHGPISVDINGGLPASTGVLTSCGSTSPNHMVVIEGWHDDPAYAAYGGGYWYMRNSWGNWADKGRIKIVYKKKDSSTKCWGIGGVSAYAVMDGVENLRTHLGL